MLLACRCRVFIARELSASLAADGSEGGSCGALGVRRSGCFLAGQIAKRDGLLSIRSFLCSTLSPFLRPDPGSCTARSCLQRDLVRGGRPEFFRRSDATASSAGPRRRAQSLRAHEAVLNMAFSKELHARPPCQSSTGADGYMAQPRFASEMRSPAVFARGFLKLVGGV